jgi:hypothetical protein
MSHGKVWIALHIAQMFNSVALTSDKSVKVNRRRDTRDEQKVSLPPGP